MTTSNNNNNNMVVVLTDEMFHEAIANYIDENKQTIDPISRHQLESLKFKWINNATDASDQVMTQEQQQQQQHTIKGILQIEGEYIVVNLEIECCWKTMQKKCDGRLTYYCRIQSAKFRDDSEDKTKEKIQSKMISRLQKDTYIMKLVSFDGKKNNNIHDNDDNDDSFLHLAHAKIEVEESRNILEERVDVSDVVAEALWRAVWSSSESSLDIIELILELPSLPTTSHANSSSSSNNNSNSTFIPTPLANRAKLRLLEDAMLDECEKEGEGELIGDLKRSHHNKVKDSNNDGVIEDGDDTKVKRPPTKKQKKSKANNNRR
jgi:hypothetical protein